MINGQDLVKVLVSDCSDFVIDFHKETNCSEQDAITVMLVALTETMAIMIKSSTSDPSRRNNVLDGIYQAIKDYPRWEEE